VNLFEQFSLTDQVAVVTGGARGLGFAMGEALVCAGASLVIVDRNQEQGERAAALLAERYTRPVAAISADVTDEQAVATLVEAIEQRFNHIDILINNAGIHHLGGAETAGFDDWKRVVDTNLNAVYLVSRYVGQKMIAAGGGRIVNIASMSGLIVNVPQPQASYNSAKAGVIMLTKSLAVEWAVHGIRVNAIAPGYMRTEMTREMFEAGGETIERWMAMTPMARPGEPEELGPLAVYLASNASSFVTGGVFTIDGGYTAV
jgi:NAD(P)-dependent dehydrogenase (short-subunit alcohol dehydrogenase family)